MSPLLITMIVLAAPPKAPEPATAAPPISRSTPPESTPIEAPPPELRQGRELQTAVRRSLQQWARPTNEQADRAARDFLGLYHEVLQDKQLTPAQRNELRHRIRGRLMALAGQITQREAIARRLARQKRPASVDGAKQPAPLAQVRPGVGPQPGFGQPGFGQPGFGQPGFGQRGFGQRGFAPRPGGVGGFGANFGGGFGGRRPTNTDNGDQLVELIYKTIAPASWDVNGGNGSIYYWRSRQALIIRQRGDVHEDIGNVLRQLERANR